MGEDEKGSVGEGEGIMLKLKNIHKANLSSTKIEDLLLVMVMVKMVRVGVGVRVKV